MIQFKKTISTESIQNGWILTAENGLLVLKNLDAKSHTVFDYGNFTSSLYKYRGDIISSIRKMLEGASVDVSVVYIDAEADSVIDKIVTANRLLF